MVITILIYLAGVTACLTAGVAASAILDPRGRWVSYRALPLGFAALILLLYPASYLAPTKATGPVIFVGLLCVVLVITLLRVRSRADLASALTPSRTDLLVGGIGVGAGILALTPVLRLGFPTTIAITNNDAWYYAGAVRWLSEGTAGEQLLSVDSGRPLEHVIGMVQGPSLGFGFELFVSALNAVIGRAAFEVVGPLSACAVPIAIAGWVWFREAIGGRSHALGIIVAAGAVLTPAFLLPFTENYLTQFTSLALMPAAIGAFVAFSDRPSVRELNRPGFDGGSGYWISTSSWSVCFVA